MSPGLRASLPSSSHCRLSSSDGLYVTDHPDDSHESSQHLDCLYRVLRKFGFGSVRYDWRWLKIEPQVGNVNQKQLAHYRRVKEIMDDVGLAAPTIVLSSPPSWAANLYRDGHTAAFLEAYQRYVEQVAASLHQAGGQPVRTVQVFNELNNRLYTFVRPMDIAAVCTITREAFRPYVGEVRLLATVLALPRRPLVDAALPFIRTHRALLESNFNVIGIDYYPGTWHWPSLRDLFTSLGEEGAQTRSGILRRMMLVVFGNTTLLEELFMELSSWQVVYELAEVGWTSYAILGGELVQKACFATFLEAYRSMLARLALRGGVMPHRFGVYNARDERATGMLRVVVKQQRWGLYDIALKPKRIVSSDIWLTVPQMVSGEALED